MTADEFIESIEVELSVLPTVVKKLDPIMRVFAMITLYKSGALKEAEVRDVEE